MSASKTAARGPGRPRIVTNKQVAQMQRDRKRGDTLQIIADRSGFSIPTVRRYTLDVDLVKKTPTKPVVRVSKKVAAVAADENVLPSKLVTKLRRERRRGDTFKAIADRWGLSIQDVRRHVNDEVKRGVKAA